MVVFLITAALLSVIQIKASTPLLLFERFYPSLGWLEVFMLSTYAFWISKNILDPSRTAKWRFRIWSFFSFVFFAQLILGLIGFDIFLMTGKLHIPVPAMIVAGPVFRGERFFMPILFTSTVLLTGPAWCSYLCYFGSWDLALARKKQRPMQMPAFRRNLQVTVLALVIFAAVVLRLAGIPTIWAAIAGIAFGIIGVVIMFAWSRKNGVMTHCTAFCPIGVLAMWLGRISPFRLKINDGCTECNACSKVCRYDALRVKDIKKRSPGSSCTLCGDCIGSCKSASLEYTFIKLKSSSARKLFVYSIVILHTIFLGVARI